MSGILNPFVSSSSLFEWLGVVDGSLGSVDFGVADPGRLIVCGVHWIFNGATPRILTSASIGGVAATIHVQDAHSGGTTGLGAAIISAEVPTGASGAVVLNFSLTVSGSEVSAFRALNLVSNTPFDLLSVRGNLSTDISGTIDVPDNGVCLIIGTGSTNTSGDNVAITGATEIYDGDGSGGTRGGALITGLAAQTGRACRYNMGSIPNSGTEMMVATWH